MHYTIVVFCILGIIQGITEFLPISSSGHLALLEAVPPIHAIFDSINQSAKLFFNVILHISSLLAIILFYWDDIRVIIRGAMYEIMHGKPYTQCRLILLIGVASIPAAVIGLLFSDWVEVALSNPSIVSVLLIANGLMLITSKQLPQKSRKCQEISIGGAFLIGIFQAIAVLPGISRSGSSIVGGLVAGLEPKEAGKFAFIMAIPVIVGAGLLELRTINDIAWNEYAVPIFCAMVVTFVVAVASLKLLVKFLQSLQLHYFGYYTIGVGLVVLLLRGVSVL